MLKFYCIGHFKLEFKHKKFGFFKPIECIIKKKICHGVKQYAKICAIGEQNVVFILGGQRIYQKRKKNNTRLNTASIGSEIME